MALEGDVVLRCLVQGPDNVYELDLRHHNGIWVYRLWSMKQKPGKRMKPLPKGWMKNPELLAQFTKKFLAHLGLGEEGETLTEQPLLVWRYDAEAQQRVVIHSTMPSWWVEPENRAAMCQAWGEQGVANPLPVGWMPPLGRKEGSPHASPPALAAE